MSKSISRSGIVVGVDGSPASKVAVYWAACDAAMRNIPSPSCTFSPAGGHVGGGADADRVR